MTVISYAYNIRHNYGKEGKRENYTPYACMKIIDSIPASGEVHGCPYKQNLATLTKDLQTFGSLADGTFCFLFCFSFPLTNRTLDSVNQVVSLAKDGHYQLACARHFELLHPGTTLLKLNHPNQYLLYFVVYYKYF